MNGVLMTVRGQVSFVDNLVSLGDMFLLCGNESKMRPGEWASDKGIFLRDDDFAYTNVALAYAWYLSPTMAGTLQAQLDDFKSPYTVADSALSSAADKSREMFLTALKSAGISSQHDFSRLTNILYKSTLDATARSLSKSYQAAPRSVRKSLDTESLAKVMTAEINICSAIYVEHVRGYADVAHKIKQHGELAQLVYRKTH